MRFLCIGDVIGRTGRNALKKFGVSGVWKTLFDI